MSVWGDPFVCVCVCVCRLVVLFEGIRFGVALKGSHSESPQFVGCPGIWSIW